LPSAFYLTILGVVACGLAIRREVQMKPLRQWHLYAPALIGLLTALVLLLLVPPLTGQRVVVWGLGFAAGFAIGLLRGALMRIQVDQMWVLVRLPHAKCALIAVVLLGLLMLGRIAADLAGPQGAPYLLPLTAAIAWCAGFLAGRSAGVAGRIRRAPHVELRQF